MKSIGRHVRARLLAAYVLGACALGMYGSTAWADIYVLDPVHTQVTFLVNHLGFSNSSGRFHVSRSALELDPQDWSKSSVQVTIPVDSLDMGDPTWKEHVTGARFLEADKYPTMTFKSTKVEVIDASHLKVTGNLTLHGVTKPVMLDTVVNKVGRNPLTRLPWAGFSATAQIKRSDFGMSNLLGLVGDDVTIRIEAEGGIGQAK